MGLGLGLGLGLGFASAMASERFIGYPGWKTVGIVSFSRAWLGFG